MSRRDEIIAKIVNENQGESEEGSRNWCQKEECAKQAWDAAIEEVRKEFYRLYENTDENRKSEFCAGSPEAILDFLDSLTEPDKGGE